MNLLHLRYFCVIAQHGNMTRAAQALHISQPALSKMLHQLEQELCHPLFYRVPGGLRLTPAGIRFYEKVSAGLELIQAGVDELYTDSAEQVQTLRVFSCINAAFLPPLYLAFQKAAPHIQLELRRGSWKEIPQAGTFDFFFAPSTFPLGPYQYTDLFEEEFVLAVPSQHPLAQFQSIDLAQAAPYPFITMGTTAPLSQYFKALCCVAQFTPKIIAECDTISTLQTFLESGQGISLVPFHSAKLDSSKLRLIRIHSPRCSRTIRLCWPIGLTFSPAERQFHSFCEEYFAPFRNSPAAEQPQTEKDV